MGKNLISQRRGRGTMRYKAPSFRYTGKPQFISYEKSKETRAIVIDIVHCQGHSSPLVEIKYEDSFGLLIAPEGIKVGDEIVFGSNADVKIGNVLPLLQIPEGTLIFNVEGSPGDGGKFARTSGTAAKVVTKLPDKIIVMLPSKKLRDFNPYCRASIGVCAGAGRTEKPFVKAGIKHYAMKARNKLYPRTSGVAMNAVDHPFGGSRTSKKGKPLIAPRDAPPGRKVGAIRPRRTGRTKR